MEFYVIREAIFVAGMEIFTLGLLRRNFDIFVSLYTRKSWVDETSCFGDLRRFLIYGWYDYFSNWCIGLLVLNLVIFLCGKIELELGHLPSLDARIVNCHNLFGTKSSEKIWIKYVIYVYIYIPLQKVFSWPAHT